MLSKALTRIDNTASPKPREARARARAMALGRGAALAAKRRSRNMMGAVPKPYDPTGTRHNAAAAANAVNCRRV
jgi:hypothetical protein